MDGQQCVGSGTKILAKANIKPKRDGVRFRTERSVRVNQALLAEWEVRLSVDDVALPVAKEANPPVWTTRIREKYPERFKKR